LKNFEEWMMKEARDSDSDLAKKERKKNKE